MLHCFGKRAYKEAKLKLYRDNLDEIKDTLQCINERLIIINATIQSKSTSDISSTLTQIHDAQIKIFKKLEIL